ncbi:Bax inhibitor-1/YccA family protein [Vallitalea pronyensis]|uniref:Bax inhibitor-1/YccA family protein n=1 Tax=Vallitalea pronyensis TaxID=1348613 RepID=A0A8J8MMH7_9FIRM|nr:Bax inhibitor-1/YccA family protein [Vallitalea pronyensis]QUI24405.1 Bax inhibitor-1/YccA family protein [Vallitalea pronyensis]
MEDRTLSVQGLNAFLSKVFMWMFLGLLTTAATAYFVAGSDQLLSFVYSNPVIYIGLIVFEFILVVVIGKNALKYTYQKTVSLFLLYSFINGVTLSIIVRLYAGESVSTAFVITAALFGVMALYGTFTKTDLTPFRSFLIIGVVGIIIATVANMFMGSSQMSYYISIAGVVIFAGLTAYDMQKMKQYYAYSVSEGGSKEGNIAVRGALTLYLDFINLFIFVLRLVGRRR